LLPEERSRKTFIGGVAVLTVSTAVVKIIGFLYKLPLIRLVGMEGMGYYLAAYHIYTVLLLLSSAGLPTAVSILVSKYLARENGNDAERVFKIAFFAFSLIGAVCGGALYIFADKIAAMIEIPQAVYCIRALSPSLVFVASGSAVKGYFQGKQDMKPTAISNLAESLSKLAFGLLFTCFAKRQGYAADVVASYAVAGLSTGSFISCVYLFLLKLIKGRLYSVKVYVEPLRKKSNFELFCELFRVAMPISLVSVTTGLAGIADTVLISSRLQSAGYSASVANLLYSSYGNLCVPIFGLVPSFVTPIALSMIPMISSAAQRNEREREKELFFSAFHLCALVAIPAAVGMTVFSSEILGLVFSGESAAVQISSPLLSYLAPAIVFSCFITLTNAALQSYGKTLTPLISMLIGTFVKFALEFVLVGNERINIAGAPVSTVLCDLTVVILNLYFIKKQTGNALPISKLLLKPLIAATLSTLVSAIAGAVALRVAGNGAFILLPIVAVNVIFYFIFALKSKTVTEKELILLPKGEKACALLRKMKLIK